MLCVEVGISDSEGPSVPNSLGHLDSSWKRMMVMKYDGYFTDIQLLFCAEIYIYMIIDE